MVIKESIILFLVGMSGSFVGALAGGGGLVTLPAMMIFGIPVQYSLGAKKFSFVSASLFNAIQILREKLVSKKILFSSTIIGLIGGFIGGLIISNIDEKILNIAVTFLLSFALIITMFKKTVEQENLRDPDENHSWLQKILSFFIAVYSGGFGPGAGTLGILLFMHQGYQYIQSAHLTRMLIMGSCAGALIIFWKSGFVNWNYAIPLTLGSIIGAHIGFKLLPKISQKAAKMMLLVITILLIVQILFKLVL